MTVHHSAARVDGAALLITCGEQRRRRCRLKHIVKATGEQQVLYVGHSQGTAVALAALSQSGYVSQHVRAAVLLAPTVFVHDTQSTILRALAALHTERCVPLMPSLCWCTGTCRCRIYGCSYVVLNAGST